jgi:hypothetical protein
MLMLFLLLILSLPVLYAFGRIFRINHNLLTIKLLNSYIKEKENEIKKARKPGFSYSLKK